MSSRFTFHVSRLKSHVSRLTLGAILAILVITADLAPLAVKVSGDERVRFGTEADRIYIVDGFYDHEETPEHGPYRWTQPYAQLRLHNWGPGRIHVSISGVGAGQEPSEAVLEVDGQAVNSVTTEPGRPWTVEAWATTTERSPLVALSGPRLDAPGDGRSLGRLVQDMEVFAPDARTRAFLHLALLALGGFLLYASLSAWTGQRLFALAAGVALPALFGPLAVFRDRWTEVVAWSVPLALGLLLLLHWRFPSWRGWRAGPRWGAALAVISLSAALALLVQGFMNSFDSDRMYQVAGGLAEYGIPTRYPGRETYTKYGFGQPLAAVPFYYLGKIGNWLGGDYYLVTRFAVSLTNIPVTALTCWLLYRGSRLFAPVWASLAVTATYLLTTPALNYARTFFAEPTGGLLLLGATLLLVPRKEEASPSGKRIAAAGALMGAMIWVKPAFAVFLPAAGLAAVLLAGMAARRAAGEERGTPGAVTRRVLAAGALFSIGPVVALAVQLFYNYIRYYPLPDAIFRTGYEKEGGFTAPFWEGLSGLLFSTGKGLVFYAPAAVIAPIGLWLIYRHGGLQGRVLALVAGAQIAAGFLFHATWWAWAGNFAWGPRMIVPVLPLLFLGLAGLAGFAARGRAALLATWAVLAVLGALVSIPGGLTDFQVYYRSYDLYIAEDPKVIPTLYDPAHSEILVQSGYLLDGMTAAIHRPSLSDTGLPSIYDLLVPLGLVLLAVSTLWALRPLRALGAEPSSNP